MPQIDQLSEIYASQLFWLIVAFGITLVFIGYGMMPKIEATVESRDRQISSDLAAADKARKASDATEAAYRAKMNEARAVAAKAAHDAKSAAVAETEAKVKAADAVDAGKLAQAEARIATQAADAMASIETVAAEAAREIVQRLSGMNVDPTAADAAVKTALAAEASR